MITRLSATTTVRMMPPTVDFIVFDCRFNVIIPDIHHWPFPKDDQTNRKLPGTRLVASITLLMSS